MIDETIDTRFELRNALFPLGEIELDLTNLRNAETLAAKLKDGSKQAWVSSYLARDIALRGTAEEALIASRRALALAEKTGDEDLRLATHSYVGQALCALGEYRQSADVMRGLLGEIASRDLSRRYGMPLPGQVMFRCWLIWALSPLGPSTEIERAMADLRRTAATVDQPLSLTVARYSCGFSLVNQGLVGEAVADLEEALALCRRWELSAWFRRIASCLGYAYACVSRIEEGLALLEDVIQRSRSRGVMPGHSLEVCWLAEAQLNANLLEDAEGNARSAISLARQCRERGNEARALSLLGEIELRVAPADEAAVEETIRAAFDHAVSMGMQPVIAKCQRLLLLLQQRRVASGVAVDGTRNGALADA
jgi:tetratricopeptide (TPR) repeat protein